MKLSFEASVIPPSAGYLGGFGIFGIHNNVVVYDVARLQLQFQISPVKFTGSRYSLSFISFFVSSNEIDVISPTFGANGGAQYIRT
jgi:hypothetical protein